MNPLLPVFVVIFSSMIGAFGSIYLKRGAGKLHRKNLLLQFFNTDLMLGIGLFLISSVFYVGAIKYGELSLLYPLTSLTYVWISFLSIYFLGEKMNLYKWAGIASIVLGVILINHPS